MKTEAPPLNRDQAVDMLIPCGVALSRMGFPRPDIQLIAWGPDGYGVKIRLRLFAWLVRQAYRLAGGDDNDEAECRGSFDDPDLGPDSDRDFSPLG